MALVLAVALVALAVGVLLGGRPSGLACYRLRGGWLVYTALAVQLAAALLLSGSAYAAALLISAGLAATFVIRNIRAPGLALVGLGLLANALVVLVNGSMPVSISAAERVGLDERALNLAADPRHDPVTDDTRLGWLGDVVPVPSPIRPEVVSPGDLLVALGVGVLVLRGCLTGRAAGRRSTGRRRTLAPSSSREDADDARLAAPPGPGD